MKPVLATRRLPGPALDRLPADVWDGDGPMPRDELLRRAAGRTGLITMLTDRVDGELLDAAGPGLRIVANYAAGHDNVDLAACRSRGVTVTNTPDVLTDATADATWTLLLAAARRVVEGDAVQRAGLPWACTGYLLGRQVSGATLGVVGYGKIGRAVARRAARFDMRVLHHGRSGTRELPRPSAADHEGRSLTGLGELLGRSDFVTVHLPATPETRRLFSAERFAAMRPGAVFVNTSRGSVVDAALADALTSGHLYAAGLDVFEDEPYAHPRLRSLANTVLTPHTGSATHEARAAMADGAPGARAVGRAARHTRPGLADLACRIAARLRPACAGWGGSGVGRCHEYVAGDVGAFGSVPVDDRRRPVVGRDTAVA